MVKKGVMKENAGRITSSALTLKDNIDKGQNRFYGINIRIAYTVSFIGQLNFIYPLITPFFLEYAGINMTLVSVLQAWFMFCIVLFELPTGLLADRMGYKKTLIFSYILMALPVAIFGICRSIPLYFLGETLSAFSNALYSGTFEAFVYNSLVSTEEKNRAASVFGNIHIFQISGQLSAALLGGIIAERFGLGVTMLAVIPTQLIGAVLMCFTHEVSGKIEKQYEHIRFSEKLGKILILKGGLKRITIDSLITGNIIFIYSLFYQLQLTEWKISLFLFGIIGLLIPLSKIGLIKIITSAEPKTAHKKTLLNIVTAVTAILIGTAVIWNEPIIGSVIIIAANGLGAARAVLIRTYLNIHIDPGRRAAVFSAISMYHKLILGVLYIPMGIAADLIGKEVFLIISVIILIWIPLNPIRRGDLDIYK